MSLGQTNVKPQYEDFEPPFDWLQDEGAHTLCVMLPGFRKEQLKVQITSSRILKLSGERKITEDKWRRFHKEQSIPNDADSGGIRAKFENGILYIRLPKEKTTTTTTPKPDEAPNAQVDQQKPGDQKTEPQTPTQTHEPPQDEQKYYEKKQMKEKGKVEERDAKKDAKDERAEAKTSRSPTLELVSRQTQEYKSAVSGLVEEIKKQKKLANLVLAIFFVLVFVLYVNNAIKSYFGGSKSQEQL